MPGDDKPMSEPKLTIVRLAADDPLDGSGAADAPDGWYEPDRLGLPRDMPGEASHAARPANASRIVEHPTSIPAAALRDDA